MRGERGVGAKMPPPPRKRGRGASQPAAAGWLRGEAERVAAVSWGRRGHEWRGPGLPGIGGRLAKWRPRSGGGCGWAAEAEDEAARGAGDEAAQRNLTVCLCFFICLQLGFAPAAGQFFFTQKNG
jgi:hypothetical protein